MSNVDLKETEYATPRILMRNKINIQPFFPSFSRVPQEVVKFQERYDTISRLLDENPSILETVHADLSRPCSATGRQSTFSSEQ
jgi:hypothetical protein